MVVSWKAPGERGVALVNAIIRQMAPWIGIIPILAFFLYDSIAENENGRVAGEGTIFLMAAALSALWYIGNSILVIAKRDPLYDRLARVAVLRE